MRTRAESVWVTIVTNPIGSLSFFYCLPSPPDIRIVKERLSVLTVGGRLNRPKGFVRGSVLCRMSVLCFGQFRAFRVAFKSCSLDPYNQEWILSSPPVSGS